MHLSNAISLAMLAVLCLVNAGCLTSRDAGTHPEVATAPAIKALALTLEGCNGFASSFDWYGPMGMGHAPPGWNDTFPNGGIGRSDIVWLIECSRIAWGPFDQPLTIYLETTNGVDEPETCPKYVDALQSIWTDSPNITAFLVDQYGLPAKVAAFAATIDASSGSQEWSWREQTSSDSVMTFSPPPPNVSGAIQGLDQFFAWDNGAGVSIIHLEPKDYPPHLGMARGTLVEPTMHAATGVGTWTGKARPFNSERFAGEILEFDDYECRLPRGVEGNSTSNSSGPARFWGRNPA